MNKTAKFHKLLHGSKVIKVAGAYDGMTAIIAERIKYDALWASGLAISVSHGVPDASILSMAEMLAAARLMNEASSLPIIADCDTGFGDVNNIVHMVHQYQKADIAAVCIEDKAFPKRNSFLAQQKLADEHEFAAKISAAANARTDPHFTIIARLESLIAGAGLDDALCRGQTYEDAGADAILIHSKSKDPHEVLEFARSWKELGRKAPLIIVPTTYNSITIDEVQAANIKMVIYANHSLRSAAQAIENTLSIIDQAGTSRPVETSIASIQDIFSLVDTENIEKTERWFEETVESYVKKSASETSGDQPGMGLTPGEKIVEGKRRMSWTEFNDSADRLVGKLQGEDFDLIVGIARGGLPAAVHLSHGLKCRSLGTVYISKTVSNTVFDLSEDSSLKIQGANLPSSTPRNILVVDDIVTYGDLFTTVSQMLEEKYGPATRITYATLFSDTAQIRAGEYSEILGSLHSVEDIDNTKVWIVFPWEREEKEEEGLLIDAASRSQEFGIAASLQRN